MICEGILSFMKECKVCDQLTDRYYSKRHLTCISCMKKEKTPSHLLPLIKRGSYEIRKFILSKPSNPLAIHPLLGCHHKKIRRHIEKQFKIGMSWESHGAWFISHIQPLSSAKTEKQAYMLLRWQNIQPLWAEVSLRRNVDCEKINAKMLSKYIHAKKNITNSKLEVLTSGELKSKLSDFVFSSEDEMFKFAEQSGYKRVGDLWTIKKLEK